MRQLIVVWAGLTLLLLGSGPAMGHSGGTDSNGGHHCREAGYNSGKCAPLGSYHCHQAGCNPAGPGGAPPSDNGSGGGGSGSSTPAPPPPPADTTAPERPTLGKATVEGATVTVPVTAERSARLAFAVGGAAVHSATASGDEQLVSFTLGDGRHTVGVTATDAAGNVSDAADFKVTVDTTAPDAPDIAVDLGEDAGAETSLSLSGEDGADYAVRLDGPEEHDEEGTLSDGKEGFSWLLPNGDYTLTVALTDQAGNTSDTAEKAFTVELPPPSPPTLTISSDPGARPIEVAVAAKGAQAVVVSLEGEEVSEEEAVELDRKGKGSVEFAVAEGHYSLEASAVDFQEQESRPARERDVVVDTTAPELALEFNDELLATGLFAYRLQSEKGALVRVASDTDALAADFTAEGGWQEFSIDVGGGDHIITVAVTDEFGNETVEEFTATVTTPFGVGEAMVLSVMLAILVGAGFGARALLRRVRKQNSNGTGERLVLPPPPA